MFCNHSTAYSGGYLVAMVSFDHSYQTLSLPSDLVPIVRFASQGRYLIMDSILFSILLPKTAEYHNQPSGDLNCANADGSYVRLAVLWKAIAKSLAQVRVYAGPKCLKAGWMRWAHFFGLLVGALLPISCLIFILHFTSAHVGALDIFVVNVPSFFE